MNSLRLLECKFAFKLDQLKEEEISRWQRCLLFLGLDIEPVDIFCPHIYDRFIPCDNATEYILLRRWSFSYGALDYSIYEMRASMNEVEIGIVYFDKIPYIFIEGGNLSWIDEIFPLFTLSLFSDICNNLFNPILSPIDAGWTHAAEAKAMCKSGYQQYQHDLNAMIASHIELAKKYQSEFKIKMMIPKSPKIMPDDFLWLETIKRSAQKIGIEIQSKCNIEFIKFIFIDWKEHHLVTVDDFSESKTFLLGPDGKIETLLYMNLKSVQTDGFDFLGDRVHSYFRLVMEVLEN